MGGGTPRKSYTKIKNFTEKDQVRVKYSHIGKDKKLMLSVYIGEEVYKALTGGLKYERLKVEYIPNDMVIITPTDNEKEGIIHRYNGKGLFKTTCVRLSLSSYKNLKIRKKDFNNRVVEYNIWFDTAHIYGCNKLNVDLIGSKKPRFINKVDLSDVAPQSYVSNVDLKPLKISTEEENIDDTHMFVTHQFLNDVRDAIENRLLGMEERFEKRIQNLEYLEQRITEVDDKIKELDRLLTSIEGHHDYRISTLEKENNLDIDTLKQLLGKINDLMNIKFSKLEREIVNLASKSVDVKEIKNIFNDIQESCGNKSLFKRIFGKE